MKDDTISRQAAIDVICLELDMIDHVPQWVYDRLENKIKQLPSVRKKGKWIHDGYNFAHGCDWIHCSVCGKRGINYCPDCGSDNRWFF